MTIGNNQISDAKAMNALRLNALAQNDWDFDATEKAAIDAVAARCPQYNGLVPNIPHYRLYDWDGSPCDTLGITGPPLSAHPEVRRLQARVYPNPASGAARIELSEPAAGQCRLRLYNLTGQLVRSEVLAAGTVGFDLPVGDLHNGRYFLHLTDEHGKVWWEKLVVLH